MAIRFFDMFAGIGGFRSGLEAVGGFKCIGHCEIDKKANTAYCAIYDTEGEYFCDDARKIDPKRMPDFDLICAGFPCQSFSVSGKRRGFSDTFTCLPVQKKSRKQRNGPIGIRILMVSVISALSIAAPFPSWRVSGWTAPLWMS